MLNFFYNKDNCLYLLVKVIVNCNKNSIEDFSQGKLKVKVKAKPKSNKANEELIKFLAKIFKIDTCNIKIVKGVKVPNKLIALFNISEEDAIKSIASYMNSRE